LTVVLYGCEAWSLILSEKHRLRVFENTVLRRIFGPMRDEVAREWRRLHHEELYDKLYVICTVFLIIYMLCKASN
jgi:hypothetical protein